MTNKDIPGGSGNIPSLSPKPNKLLNLLWWLLVIGSLGVSLWYNFK
jgi:hypothetical protein